MVTLTVELPDGLWRRMQEVPDENWSGVATRAFEARLRDICGGDGSEPASTAVHHSRASGDRFIQAQRRAGYSSGYSWARDRAPFSDLKAMIEAPTHDAAVRVVRESRRFSERDEFGDALRPSDEMWEAFVDGATALYRDVVGRS